MHAIALIFQGVESFVYNFLASRSSCILKLISENYAYLSEKISIALKFVKASFLDSYLMKFLDNFFDIFCILYLLSLCNEPIKT